MATRKGDRPANTRLYKVLYWLEMARRAGGDVSEVLDAAQVAAHYAGTPGASADKIAITRNRENLAKSAKVTAREVTLARRWHREGPLLTVRLTPEIARRIVDAFHQPASDNAGGLQLSRREREVLKQLGDGLGTKEIARRLEITPDIVRVHLRHIYKKLQVGSRSLKLR